MSAPTNRGYWSFMRVLLAGVLVAGLVPFAWYVWYRESIFTVGRDTAVGLLRDPSTIAGDLFVLDDLRIPAGSIKPTGRGIDATPSLTTPGTIPAKEVEYLRDVDRLLVLEIDGVTRAYPVRLLNYHQVVNDTIGDVNFAVIYCPLSDAFCVVDRRLDDGYVVEFGVTGCVYNSNSLLYDLSDRSLWTQLGLGAVSGPHAGQRLRYINQWRLVTFQHLLDEDPDTRVLSDYTGYARGYRRNPYRWYYSEGTVLYPLDHEDQGVPFRTRVIAVAYPDGRRDAYLLDSIDGELQDGDLLVRRDPAEDSLEVVSAPQGAAVFCTMYFPWHALYPETRRVGW